MRKLSFYLVVFFIGLSFVLSLPQKAFALSEPELVKDINPGAASSYISIFESMGDSIYFMVDETQLWSSDGTDTGTVMIKDFSSFSGPPENIVATSNILYFSVVDDIYGQELWGSDGTEAGTNIVKDINPSGNSSPSSLTAIGSILYFVANDGVHGRMLWKSDGTEAGTVIVKDISSGYTSSDLIAVENTLYFSADNVTNGRELWKSDGTETGTIMVKDIWPGIDPSNANPLDSIGDILYFLANDGVHGQELWKSDGTDDGTVIVKDIVSGAGDVHLWNMDSIGSILYLSVWNGINSNNLWKTDGTDAGTVLVKDGIEAVPYHSLSIGNIIYFRAYHNSTGYELWKSDGTDTGTVLIKDLNLGIANGYPNPLGSLGDVLYFSVDDGVHGYEIWKTDGTDAGTIIVEDINLGISSSSQHYSIKYDNSIYFTANDGIHGGELWKLTVDITPPLGSLNINLGNAYTTSTAVSLSLSATDDLSEVTEMMLCNNSSFTGCTWEPYSTSKSWTLDSALGEKTVYVKFKDAENNISEAFSDTITYHVLEVDFVSIGTITDIPADSSLSFQLSSTSQVFRGTTQPGSTVFFVVGGQTFSTVADSNGDFSITLTLSEGSNEVQYYVKDLSNNQSETRTMSITVTPPAVVPVRWTLPNTGEENLEVSPTVSPTISITITETPSTTLRPSLTPTIKPSTEEQDPDYVYIGPIKIKKGDIQVAKVLSESVSNTGAVTMLIVAPLSLAILPQIFSKGFLWYLPPKKRKPWGVIYDLGTRKPIAFAIVRILDNTGKVLKETVSDLKGRYDFILDPGTYTMEIESGAFAKFTSQVTIRSTDEQHTEDIGLAKGSGINRFMLKEKLYYIYLYTFWTIGTIGLIFSGISLILGFDVLNVLILIFYAVQIYFLLKTRKPQNWGYVFDTMNNNRLTGVFVRVLGVTDGRQLNVILTDEKGRFSLRLDEGDYLLKTDMPGYILSEADYHIETLPTGDKVAKINAVDLKNGVELGMAKA